MRFREITGNNGYIEEHVKGGLDSYYQLSKAKSLAKADGHDYDKLPEYHRGADQPHKEKYKALAKEVNEVSDFKKRELEYELRHEEPKRDSKKRRPYRTPQERMQDANKRNSKEVKEAKGLGKRVKVVKGHFAGEEGTIREIKHGAFKGAPKSYYIDLDNGEMADNLPADVLRLIKRTDEKEKMLTLKDIDNGGKKDVKLTFKRKPDGTPIDKKQPQKETTEESFDCDDTFFETYGWLDGESLEEAEYQGRTVKLNKPMQGDTKKFKVYVKDPKTGNTKKVNFGHGGSSVKGKAMKIKKNNPGARKSFRARHNCDSPGPKTKARYWSCRKW